MAKKDGRSLRSKAKEKLIEQAVKRRIRRHSDQQAEAGDVAVPKVAAQGEAFESLCDFRRFPGYQEVLLQKSAADKLGLENPFYKLHDGVAAETSVVEGKNCFNFSSYNYLGLNGDPRVQEAAKQAIDRYGVSPSASRLVSGERPIQQELERALAELHEADDAVVFVSGHGTNVNTIGHLFGPKDLVVHDALIHNSVLQGIQLSRAFRLSFPHNDWDALDALLRRRRRDFQRVLIVLEGLYSMDGDYPDLPRFIEIKQRHNALLMVDEAHSIGVLGKTGKGIAEHFDVEPRQVDIWMGTLSKTFSSCGGYIAGNTALVEILKSGASGFVYSVGLAPVLAAAALESLRIMLQEPERVDKLRRNGQLFDELVRAKGIDTGLNCKLAIIPVITGGSIKATRLSNLLFERGINVQPIIYPAVEEKLARLRFFICSTHSEQQLRQTADHLEAALKAVG